MKLIVGLGNPGSKYAKTKHNVGFQTIDNYAAKNNVSLTKEKFEGLYEKYDVNGETVILLKPLTYMNESGRSVGQFARFFKIDPDDILVIQDDMDLPVAKIRLRGNGSAGGHNGIKSIIAHLGTQDFKRLKIGIQHPNREKVVDWVLTPFDKDAQLQLDQSYEKAIMIINDFIAGNNLQQLMNKYN